ncbi:MAG: hypothetical protein JSV11_07940 [Nitrospiraceae bacterium]|nr:MAG: hypothetical protein JSV11_07940 [Nitrospiraceae bacterium]
MANKQNYMKKMELKNQLRQDAGLISERYPKVRGMVINMTYYHKAENPVLMQRTVNFFPTSHAYFNMECMIRGCEGGGFDLTRIIKKQIKDKKKVAKGEMICKGKNGELVSNHSHIIYEINIQYGKKKTSPKPAPIKTEQAPPAVKTKARPTTAVTTKAKTPKKAATRPKTAVKTKAKAPKKAKAKPKTAVKTKAKTPKKAKAKPKTAVKTKAKAPKKAKAKPKTAVKTKAKTPKKAKAKPKAAVKARAKAKKKTR